MTVRRDYAPGNLVRSARNSSTNATDERMHIVRIVRNPELCAAPIGPDKRDLAQLGDDLLAEDETNRLRRLREMAVRRWCRAEQARVQQYSGRGARDCRAGRETESNRHRSQYAATIERQASDQEVQCRPS